MDIQADGVGDSVSTRVTIGWEDSAIGVVSSPHHTNTKKSKDVTTNGTKYYNAGQKTQLQMQTKIELMVTTLQSKMSYSKRRKKSLLGMKSNKE